MTQATSSEITAVADASVESGVVVIRDGNFAYRFRYASSKEKNRGLRIFDKEPGTVDWIRKELRPDDVFYDVGANVGVYSILAGCRLSAQGRVIAFEPHIPNAASLLENIFLNDLQRRAQIINLPLTSHDGFNTFHYFSEKRGSSTSQLGRTVSELEPFDPVCSEVKYGVTIDSLVEHGLIPRPDMIKIDVDGLELEVLAGMSRLLHSPGKPRSVQCEISKDNKEQILGFFADAGYRAGQSHWTKAGMDSMASGETVGDYPFYYVVFFAEEAQA